MEEVDLSVILLHADMLDKQGTLVTTSITMLDVHDLARSARTYGVKQIFISHPSIVMRKLVRTLKSHWEEGFGATYNPNRKEALEVVELVSSLDEAIHKIDLRCGNLPRLIATSAKEGKERCTFAELRSTLKAGAPHLLMLGTGWGMSAPLLQRADLFLEPIRGRGPYNHLSVRSAGAIMMDRLLG